MQKSKFDPKFLAENLRKIRGTRTLQETAAGIGVCMKTYKKWEAGTQVPRVSQLVNAAKFFRCTLAHLLGTE